MAPQLNQEVKLKVTVEDASITVLVNDEEITSADWATGNNSTLTSHLATLNNAINGNAFVGFGVSLSTVFLFNATVQSFKVNNEEYVKAPEKTKPDPGGTDPTEPETDEPNNDGLKIETTSSHNCR